MNKLYFSADNILENSHTTIGEVAMNLKRILCFNLYFDYHAFYYL